MDDIKELKAIFPQFDMEVIESVYASCSRNRDETVNALLCLVDDNPNSSHADDAKQAQIQQDEILARNLAFDQSNNQTQPENENDLNFERIFLLTSFQQGAVGTNWGLDKEWHQQGSF